MKITHVCCHLISFETVDLREGTVQEIDPIFHKYADLLPWREFNQEIKICESNLQRRTVTLMSVTFATKGVQTMLIVPITAR